MISTHSDGHDTIRDLSAFGSAIAYWRDAWQRSVLTLEALNERGNIHLAQAAKEVPNVLNFANELVLDGRKLPRPVNYGLVRITPPDGAAVDPSKPPVVVVDPRAGHGPGIGGMKPDSEIGVAIRAGHPCYFVGFSPEPMPGQTIEDVCRAEAAFIEEVARRHPDAESKPIVIANCQAGWQTMMTAAIHPDLMGPIVVAGSPLSYWAGVRGKNPMRYTGRHARRRVADRALRRPRRRQVRRREPHRQFRAAQFGKHLLDEGIQRLFQGRHREAALSRIRDLLGQSGPAQRRRNAMDRRQSVRRQQTFDRPDPHLRRASDRPAKHQVADRLLLFLGRQHHAATAGARLDSRPLRQRRRDRRQRADHRLLAASQHRASRHLRLGAWSHRKSTRSSSPAWT